MSIHNKGHKKAQKTQKLWILNDKCPFCPI